MKLALRLAAFVSSVLPVAVAHAAALTISTGVTSSVPSVLNGIVDLLLMWSSLVATALFLLGSLLMVGSGGNDATLSNGKKIMKASLIGLAIILSSWLILSTAVSFIAP
jgi:hypothetical protein